MKQYLLCRWQEEAFAIDTSEVLELLRMVQITRLPSESGRIDGLLNYRGEVIPVMDCCRLFRRPSVSYDADSLIAVMRHQGQGVAVVAHELLELHEIEESQLRVHDSTGAEAFDASLSIEGRLYPVLNIGRLQQDALASLQQMASTT